ncbi:MAG: putative Ig domain-containing protein [Acidobacteriia bacterium]|nr:putative Ig domain-containing protein [Terriglobia bacterium]
MPGATKYFLAAFAAAFFLLHPYFAGAQTSLPLQRITNSVDDRQLTRIHGNLHPWAQAQNDRGAADPSLMLQRITIMFQPTASQQADLDALLAAQQNPTSPSFHHWLSPQQFGDRFGIAPADLAKVAAWLQSMGFAVVETPASRNFIVFEGTAAEVSAAFHTEIHNYEAKGQDFFANSSEPSLPAALAGLVAGFRGLNSVRLQPRAVPSKTAGASVRPDFTSSLTGTTYITPADFATIYDLNPLYAATPPIDGTGQKIAVVGQSQIVPGDIAAFRSSSGLPPNVPQTILVPSSPNPGVLNGDVQESSLDLEWSGAVAPGASIIFVYSGNGVMDALQYAISQNLAPILSLSYGSCEAVNPPGEILALAFLAQQANAQGITIVSSAGDSGATDCDGSLSPPNYPAELGFSVDFPSSLPYVTSVGGTEFNEGNGTYWQSAGGADVISSALSYIPEMVWNDTSSLNGFDAGGGGASSIFGKPSWQVDTGVPDDGARDTPDISMDASNAHDPYLICTEIQLTPNGPLTPGCQNGFRISATNPGLSAYGGTSFGAPTFAGILALVNQKTASAGQGNVNYILYPLAVLASSAFHDVIVGNNDSPCVFQSANCLDGNPNGFKAGLGYDRATGLGTIDAANLVNSWPSANSASGGSTPVLTSIAPTSIAAGSDDFTLTASGTNFATNAQILWNGSTAGVTMQSGGTSTTVKATISRDLVAYGSSTAGIPGAQAPFTSTFISVTEDSAKAAESSTKLPFTVIASPPPNDNIASATVITSSNYSGMVDNSAATSEPTDPVPPCVVGSSNPDTKTVWWTFTSTGKASVTVSTLGSSYDTTLSVWTGTPGNLTSVACNDDVSSGRYTNTLLKFTTNIGATYYILVAPYGPVAGAPPADQAGGKTVLNVTHAPLAPAAPVITSANTTTYILDVEGNFTFTATGSPAPMFSESGLIPGGLSVNGITGALSGIPGFGSQGVYPITITASNGVGPPATQQFTLIANQVASFANPSSATFLAGTPGYFQFAAAGFPSPEISESGALPHGIAYDPFGQDLSGTPPAGSGGVYYLTFTAHNGVASDDVQHFTLNVNEAPAFTSAASATFPLNALGTFRVTVTGSPVPALSESGDLPAGVSFNAATGVFIGTPAMGSASSYSIILTAGNGVGANATQNFTLVVGRPVLSSLPTSQTVAAGATATYMIANPGGSITALSCSGLPAGASCGAVSVPPNSSAPLVITTSSRAAAFPAFPQRRLLQIGASPGASIALLVSLVILFAGRKGTRLSLVSPGSLALLFVFAAAGCGLVGSSPPPPTPQGTPAGTYTITITGNATGVPAQPVAITLIVT